MAKKKNSSKRIRRSTRSFRRRFNPDWAQDIEYFDYKDLALLRKLTTERGKIRSRRMTGVTRHQQAQAMRAIKFARELALAPYVVEQVRERRQRTSGYDNDRNDRGDRGERNDRNERSYSDGAQSKDSRD